LNLSFAFSHSFVSLVTSLTLRALASRIHSLTLPYAFFKLLLFTNSHIFHLLTTLSSRSFPLTHFSNAISLHPHCTHSFFPHLTRYSSQLLTVHLLTAISVYSLPSSSLVTFPSPRIPCTYLLARCTLHFEMVFLFVVLRLIYTIFPPLRV